MVLIPSLKIHCRISKRRTGYEFKELHKWIDEPYKKMGVDHRIYRHAFNMDDMKFIEKEWGTIGVVEWLVHIAVDNLDTAFKFSKNCWHEFHKKPFNYFEFSCVDGRYYFKSRNNKKKTLKKR